MPISAAGNESKNSLTGTGENKKFSTWDEEIETWDESLPKTWDTAGQFGTKETKNSVSGTLENKT